MTLLFSTHTKRKDECGVALKELQWLCRPRFHCVRLSGSEAGEGSGDLCRRRKKFRLESPPWKAPLVPSSTSTSHICCHHLPYFLFRVLWCKIMMFIHPCQCVQVVAVVVTLQTPFTQFSISQNDFADGNVIKQEVHEII